MSFDRMNRILDFVKQDRVVTCQAGVITQTLQDYAAEQNLFYPVDFASAGSSQIGGNVATNAGGIKVIRYGLTRDWVAGMRVVTGGGALLNCNAGLVKNATGYDIRHLMIGSEGTLGLICEVDVRLEAQPEPQTVMVVGVPRGRRSLERAFGIFRCSDPFRLRVLFRPRAQEGPGSPQLAGSVERTRRLLRAPRVRRLGNGRRERRVRAVRERGLGGGRRGQSIRSASPVIVAIARGGSRKASPPIRPTRTIYPCGSPTFPSS